MLITKENILTGESNTLDLPVTQAQLDAWNNGKGTAIQYVMPHLTADEREFLISGMLPGEFDERFSGLEDNDI